MSKFDYLAYAEMERQEVEPRQELEQKELHLNKGENTDQKTVVPFCMSEEIKNSEILQTEERSVDTKESSVPSDWLKQETDDEMVGVEEKGFIPSPSLNAIDLHRYSYTYRSAQDSSQRDRKMLSKTTLDKVRDFLSKEHRKLFQESIIDRLKRKALSAIVSEYISSQNIVETGYTADELIKTVVDSLAGLDVLEDLLENEAITDINVNGKNEIWIEELGKGYYLTDLKFASDDVLRGVCAKIVNASGETLNTAKPYVDCRFPGMRINIVGPEICGAGYSISIRKFAKTVRINDISMVKSNQANEDMIKALEAFVIGKKNILIAGSTGSGKTELLKYLVKHIPKEQRMIMLEDTAETRLKDLYPNKHILMMECRFTGEEETSVDYLKLLRNTLRQNPSRIGVGECRGAEADQMMKIFNTGHEGGMTTVHANSAAESVDRLINMVMETGLRLDPDIIGKRVTSTFDIVIFQKKMEDGGRRIREIVELVDYRDNKPIFNTLYQLKIDEFERNGDGTVKRLKCHHEQVGFLQTKTVEKLLEDGVRLELFEVLIHPKDKEALGLA